jgi:hypothetical protein
MIDVNGATFTASESRGLQGRTRSQLRPGSPSSAVSLNVPRRLASESYVELFFEHRPYFLMNWLDIIVG